MNFGAMQNRCVECDEIITNPICPECLAKKMRLVVSEHDKKLAEDIVSANVDGETTCIICGLEMGVCAHCFSKEIYEMLVSKGYQQQKEFMARFDFFLRKEWNDYY